MTSFESWLKEKVPAAIAFLGFLLLWQAIGFFKIVPDYLLPTPTQVVATFQELRADFVGAFLSTLSSTLWGFLVSLVLGVAMACLFSLSPWLKRAFLPFAVFFQTVPIIAIAPLMVIWFGFGEPTVRASAMIVSFFPILASLMTGLDLIEAQWLELFRVYKASQWQVLLKLKIPLALPSFFNGLRVGVGLAVIGAIVGEFVGGGGLGGLIDSARTQQRPDIVFAAVFLCSVLGLFLVSVVNLVMDLVLKWRPFFVRERRSL